MRRKSAIEVSFVSLSEAEIGSKPEKEGEGNLALPSKTSLSSCDYASFIYMWVAAMPTEANQARERAQLGYLEEGRKKPSGPSFFLLHRPL